MLIGIVVQRLTSRDSRKMEPPDLVVETNQMPVPEMLQVHVRPITGKDGSLLHKYNCCCISFISFSMLYLPFLSSVPHVFIFCIIRFHCCEFSQL